MVQKLNNNRIELISTGEDFRNATKSIDATNYSAIFHAYKQKTIAELFEIISLNKIRNYRLIAVYLLGKLDVANQEVIDFLRNLVTYENIDIRKEAIWSLARLGDKNILPKLINILKTGATDLEKSITAKLIGKIGNEHVILPLLKLLIESAPLSSLSAGIALHHLINCIGYEAITKYLRHPELKIRTQVIWFLCSKTMFSNQQEEKRILIIQLKKALQSENNCNVKLVLAYALSTLNVIEGAKELLCFCLSNKIKKERQNFFWEEITRFYIYSQKQASLELTSKLNNALSGNDQILSHTNKAIFSLLKKLEDTISNLDKIFDLPQ